MILYFLTLYGFLSFTFVGTTRVVMEVAIRILLVVILGKLGQVEDTHQLVKSADLVGSHLAVVVGMLPGFGVACHLVGIRITVAGIVVAVAYRIVGAVLEGMLRVDQTAAVVHTERPLRDVRIEQHRHDDHQTEAHHGVHLTKVRNSQRSHCDDSRISTCGSVGSHHSTRKDTINSRSRSGLTHLFYDGQAQSYL